MLHSSLAAFVVVAGILVLTPGVGTTFLMSTVISHGRRAGYLTALGMVLGAALHAIVAAVGTAVLLRRFPEALTVIALVGGTFIALLGVSGILRAIRPQTDPAAASPQPPSGHGIVATGVLIALSNAPIPLFYFVVVPEYLPPGMSRIAGAALLSAIHIAMAGTWMATFVTLVDGMVEVLRQPRVRIGLQCATGLLLIALGARAVAGAI